MEIFDHKSLYDSGGSPQKNKHSKWHIIIAVIVAVLVLAVGALGGILIYKNTQHVCPPVPPGTSCEQPTEVFYQNILKSTVAVDIFGSVGSGVVVSIGGETYIITNHHVIKNLGAVTVRYYGTYTDVSAVIIGYDAYHDIALLKPISVPDSAIVASINPQINSVAGDRVYAAGNSLGSGIIIADGMVSNPHRMIDQADKRVPVIQVTAPINAGMSGGGLFDSNGLLIGINTYQTVWTAGSGGDRPVDATGYSVPAPIASSIINRIVSANSSDIVTDVKKIDMMITPDAGKNEVYFTGLSFRAVYTDLGLKVTLATPNTNILGGTIAVGDIVTKIGDLNVTSQTTYAQLYNQVLKYQPIDSPPENHELLQIMLSSGNNQKVLTYHGVVKII